MIEEYLNNEKLDNDVINNKNLDNDVINNKKLDNENIINPILNEEQIDELKELIKNWLDLDDKLKMLSDQTKDLRMEKNQYETYILELMEKTNKEVIKTTDTTLKKNIRQSKSSPKEENILNSLTSILEDPDKAYRITQQIISSLPTKEIISLKKENKDNKNKKIKK